MKIEKTYQLLQEIQKMDMPISNTIKGKQIHQTFRNNLTAKIKQMFYEDCMQSMANGDEGIFPYLAKDGVIIEIPNASVVDCLEADDLGSGAISLEIKFAIKNLDCDANELADEYSFKLAQDAERAAKAEKDKQAKIERDRKNRELREKKKQKMYDMAFYGKD